MKDLHLSKKDFKVQTFRSGGPGGQHQNTTDSGVRITHIETGLSSESREFRSQKQNKDSAFLKLSKLILNHYSVEENERYRGKNQVIRTYDENHDLVKDEQTGRKYSYKRTIGKNDLSKIIFDRNLFLNE